jgi:hypothetical protein
MKVPSVYLPFVLLFMHASGSSIVEREHSLQLRAFFRSMSTLSADTPPYYVYDDMGWQDATFDGELMTDVCTLPAGRTKGFGIEGNNANSVKGQPFIGELCLAWCPLSR